MGPGAPGAPKPKTRGKSPPRPGRRENPGSPRGGASSKAPAGNPGFGGGKMPGGPPSGEKRFGGGDRPGETRGRFGPPGGASRAPLGVFWGKRGAGGPKTRPWGAQDLLSRPLPRRSPAALGSKNPGLGGLSPMEATGKNGVSPAGGLEGAPFGPGGGGPQKHPPAPSVLKPVGKGFGGVPPGGEKGARGPCPLEARGPPFSGWGAGQKARRPPGSGFFPGRGRRGDRGYGGPGP